MNRLTTLDINKLTPYAVGFDRVFDDMFKYVQHNANSTGYPPYNIVRDGDKFQIEIALAGIAKEDLEITVAESVLTIEHNPEGEVEPEGWQWIHKGISQRKFKQCAKDNAQPNRPRKRVNVNRIEAHRSDFVRAVRKRPLTAGTDCVSVVTIKTFR